MDKLVLRQSEHGKSVFAKADILKGELIIEFHGKILTYEQLPSPYETVEDHYVPIGEKLYMGPSGGLDDFLNHCCDPNSGLKIRGEQVVLIAIRNIKQGEEVCWDYSTTMDENEWEMDCDCKSPKCRGRIRDFKHLPLKIQRKYIGLGIVPCSLSNN